MVAVWRAMGEMRRARHEWDVTQSRSIGAFNTLAVVVDPNGTVRGISMLVNPSHDE